MKSVFVPVLLICLSGCSPLYNDNVNSSNQNFYYLNLDSERNKPSIFEMDKAYCQLYVQGAVPLQPLQTKSPQTYKYSEFGTLNGLPYSSQGTIYQDNLSNLVDNLDALSKRLTAQAKQAELFQVCLKAKGWYPTQDANHPGLNYLVVASDYGNADAQLTLGKMYFNGDGVDQNYANAFDLFQKAANQGKSEAIVYLAQLYENGLGTSVDKAKAFDLYQKAADKGNPVALNKIGLMYRNGEGVKKNLSKAKDLFEKSCDTGDFEGCGLYRDFEDPEFKHKK